MCSQCLMDSFQAHKHDAPDIIGYRVFLESADSCLKDNYCQRQSTGSKSLDILQQLLDENKSRLSVTRTKAFEILDKCFTSLSAEICSIESNLKAKVESDAGLVTRLEQLTRQLINKQGTPHHGENDVMFLASFLTRDSKQNTFRLNTDRFKRTVGARNSDKELRELRDRCDDFRKTLAVIASWSQKLKKGFEGNQIAALAPELRTVFSPTKRKGVSAAKKQPSSQCGKTRRHAKFRITDKENGDIVRKRLHMNLIQYDSKDINKYVDTLEPNSRKASHGAEGPMISLRGNLRLSPTRHAAKKITGGPLTDRLGPFSFLDSLSLPRLEPVKKNSEVHEVGDSDATTRSSTGFIMQTPVPCNFSHIDRTNGDDNAASGLSTSSYMLARRFDEDGGLQAMNYLESHAITFTCSKDLSIHGFGQYKVAESQPNFVAHMQYALIEGNGIDEDGNVSVIRTGDFQLKNDTERRLKRVFLERPARLSCGKFYTVRVTSKSKTKFSCWKGKGCKESCGPFRFRESKQSEFYRLITNVLAGQIPELIYSI